MTRRPRIIPHERYLDNKWGIVLCALLMENAEESRALAAIKDVIERWPQWSDLRNELGVHYNHEGQIEVKDQVSWQWLMDTVSPVGRGHTRVTRLLRWLLHFAIEGLPKTSQDIRTLPGATRYAEDCWRLFIEKDYTTPVLSDSHLLEEYRTWKR